jgi:hypothetical protein
MNKSKNQSKKVSAPETRDPLKHTKALVKREYARWVRECKAEAKASTAPEAVRESDAEIDTRFIKKDYIESRVAAWFCNYETEQQARKAADGLNELADQLRGGFGLPMLLDAYDYSVGSPLKVSDQVTDSWAGLYRTLRQEAAQ